MQRYGGRIQQVMLSADWYRENMPRYKAAFEDGSIELPRDADILAVHRALIMERGIVHVAERRTRGETGKPRHGDSAIAGALAYYASRMKTNEFAYMPSGDSRNRDALRARSSDDDEQPFQRGGRFGSIIGAW